MQKNISNIERVTSVAIGAALLGLASRYPRLKSAAAAAGVGLLARGASGFCPVSAAIGRNSRDGNTRTALSGTGGTRIEARMAIDRTPEELYDYWRDLRNLPTFMRHIERIDVLDDRRSHWVMRGPAGVRLEWDAEIINQIEPALIAWRSLPGADVVSAGSVKFRPLDRGTELEVIMQYDPPAGKLGAALAWLTGQGAQATLEEDLRQLKHAMEFDAMAFEGGAHEGLTPQLANR